MFRAFQGVRELAKHPERRTREGMIDIVGRLGRLVLGIGILMIILYTAGGMAPDRKKLCNPYCASPSTLAQCAACARIIPRADTINTLTDCKFVVYILVGAALIVETRNSVYRAPTTAFVAAGGLTMVILGIVGAAVVISLAPYVKR